MRNCGGGGGGGVCVRWGVSKRECLMSCRLRHCSIQARGGERERARETKCGEGGHKEKETESINVCLVTI